MTGSTGWQKKFYKHFQVVLSSVWRLEVHGYYAGVAGGIPVLHKVTRSKQCSINVIEQGLCFHYNPALSGTLFGEIETFVTKHG